MIEIITNNKLNIEIQRKDSEVEMVLKGKSVSRNPGDFITPLLNQLARECGNKKVLKMNFREIKYLNSSTITPIVRFLEDCRNNSSKIHIVYDNHIKWQELSFSALEIFETEDQRIRIIGDSDESTD